MRTCLGVVQVRMSSTRLPGKSLRLLHGKPLLAHVLDRLSACAALGQVVVATSRDPSDDPIASFCAERGGLCFRGELNNVRARFEEVLSHFSSPVFARINGDSPLYDPELLEQACSIFEAGNYEIVSNAFRKSFPSGFGVEIIQTDAFLRSAERVPLDSIDEHVTSHFYRFPQKFRHYSLEAPRDFSKVRLSIDTLEDFARVEQVMAEIGNSTERSSWADFAKAYERLAQRVSGV